MFPSPSAHQHLKRPITIPRNLLPPSVSFVVAAPQQTHSLASAAGSLLNIRRAMPPDPSQSNTTPITADNHNQSSTAHDSPESPPVNAVHEFDQPASVSQGPTPPALPSGVTLVHLTPHPNQLPTPVDPPNTPTAISQDPAPILSLSNQRSWFNMFWSRNKGTLVAEVKVEMDSAPNVPDTTHTGTDLFNDRSQSLSLEVIRPIDATDAIGDSGPREDLQSLPNGAASGSPHSAPISQPKLNQVDGTHVREEEMASLPSLSPFPHHSLVSQTQEGISSPVAPNSATSIFAFNIPMFAKSRSSPAISVAPSPQHPSTEPSCEPSVATPDPGNTAVVNVAESTPMTSASIVHVPECGDQPLNQPPAATEVRTNAWLTYLGLNRSSSAAEADSRAQAQSSVAHVSSAASDQPPTSDLLESPQPECEVHARADLGSDGSAMEHSAPGDKKPPSTHNADAASVPQSSTWYTSWFWYQSSSSVTTVAPGTSFDSQQDPPERSEMRPETEEKQPTEEHKAHSASNQASSPPHGPSAIGSAGFGNPIQSAISSNPTRWMSLFTAKAIAMKSITYEKENTEMEVMEIDDEMAPEPNSTSSAAPTTTQPSPTQVTNPSVRAQPHTSDILPPSSPLKKSDDRRSSILHPTTCPETIANDTLKRQPSPSPSKKSGVKAPPSPPPPNLVLPTWNDTFHTLPRSVVPHEPPSALSKTLQYVSGVLFPRNETTSNKGKAKEIVYSPYDKVLPRTWDVLGVGEAVDVLRGCKRVVMIGIHGWFPGAVLRTFAGEPTGTSIKLVNGLAEALGLFQEEHEMKLDKVTKIPLEGEGTINRRVERLYQNLIGNKEWMEDLHNADAIFVATHSQGSVVSTHVLDRLIIDRHIRTTLNADASIPASDAASGSMRPAQRICCLALCGIHLGPLRYLSMSSLVQPYIQYFESTAARELFEFQNTESVISRDYVRALRNVLNNGIKMVYVASLNDQVVGLYSGLFASVSHPLILRALYIDGDAYHPSDFLANLLVLLLRIRNAGLSDGGLLTHLSEATAGSLNGIGHSTPYEERATYSLAINYLFLTDSGSGALVELTEEPFNALTERNDYEIPWALRDLIADDRVASLFSDQIVTLRNAFRDWQPKSAVLRDVKKKLQPIQRLSSTLLSSHTSRL